MAASKREAQQRMIAAGKDPCAIAKLKMLRAFYTDWTFRAQLRLQTWQSNHQRQAVRAQLESIHV